MHLPGVANLSTVIASYVANIIAETIEMVVKSTRFYPNFGRKGMCNRSAKVGIKSCGFYQYFYCSNYDVS